MSATTDARPAPVALRRILTALVWGAICHAVFFVAVATMIWSMFHGMSRAFGTVPQPWAWMANIALILQFPLGHSLLLTGRGRRLVARLAPFGYGETLSVTTYAIIAALQVGLLFALWTPSSVIWWQAEGAALWVLAALYSASWLLLMKASWDAGITVQSGLLGWTSLLLGRRPKFPPMPTRGLFRLVRQPIYVSFALTLWTVPTWTPDQLMLAGLLTLYCVLGPRLKERRFARLFGADWHAYRVRVPYWLPSSRRP
jgi:protein-S-isoprenylcysteine O-methyltransferase Ste14